MQAGIDRRSLLPFYHQLKQLLLADIAAHDRRPGDRLPSDHELCAAYDVSRTVVRQALAELESEGVIERFKGKGTFVAQPRTAEGLVQSLTGLYEDVAARGGHLRSEVLRQEVVPADDRTAQDLALEPGEPVVVLERLRFVDHEPWVWATTRVPQRLAPGLEHEDLRDRSLSAVLEQGYGVRLAHGRRSVEATCAGAELSRRLGIARDAALLVLRSTSYASDDRPVEVFVAYHRGDRSRFEVDLTRAAGGGVRPLMHLTGRPDGV